LSKEEAIVGLMRDCPDRGRELAGLYASVSRSLSLMDRSEEKCRRAAKDGRISYRSKLEATTIAMRPDKASRLSPNSDSTRHKGVLRCLRARGCTCRDLRALFLTGRSVRDRFHLFLQPLFLAGRTSGLEECLFLTPRRGSHGANRFVCARGCSLTGETLLFACV